MVHYIRSTVAFISLLALALAACGSEPEEQVESETADSEEPTASEAAEAEETLAIEMNLYSRSLPYFQDVIEGAQTKADELGVTLNVTYGETDPQVQYEQIENAIIQRPDGLIIVPVDPSSLIPVIAEADASGIAVLTAVNDIDEEGHEYQVAHVGKDYYDVGREKAEYIVDQLGGEGSVAIIHGIRGLLFTESQGQGAMDVFDEHAGITVIDGPYTGEFSTDAGLTAAENVLTANPDVDALYFDNDDIALGGVLAAEQRGMSMDDIIIIGTDGGEPARRSVGDGELDMTITLCGVSTGANAVQVLVEYLRDGSRAGDRVVDVESLMITQDNYDDAEGMIAAGDC